MKSPSLFPVQLNHLIQSLSRLPGIGPKSARRIAFHLLETPAEQARELVDAIQNVKEKLKPCNRCAFPIEGELCLFCDDDQREKGQICIVEKSQDILSIEKTGVYHGHYHSLGALLSPLDGIEAADIRFYELMQRIDQGNFSEAVLALNPTTEGEATTHFIAQALKEKGLRTMRISFGLAMGSEIEFADGLSLARSLSGRIDF